MPERGTAEIRREMAVERRHLDESREKLLAELRSLVPVVVICLVALGLIAARRGIRRGITTIRTLS